MPGSSTSTSATAISSSPITIGPIVLQSISPLIHKFEGVIDCHLMVSNPEHHFEMIKKAGGDSVTFHVEACEEPWKAIKHARDLGLGVGVAFNPETSVEDAVGASIGADLVLCMSIHPGYSGQEFMPESLERIAALRSQLHKNLFVQVDGGIGEGNIADVRRAGAQAAVAGSAIFGREDYPRAYRQLVEGLCRSRLSARSSWPSADAARPTPTRWSGRS